MSPTTLTPQRAAIFLSLATLITAQQGFGSDSYSNFGGQNGGSSSNSNSNSGSSSSNPYGGGSSSDRNGGIPSQYLDRGRTIITAHAVLATLAFGFFFPVGGIMIRLASFPGLWWVHGLFQIFGFLLYTAAFGIGIWMCKNFYTLNDAHPIIGIVLFALLAFQPLLGYLHHAYFKKYNKRTIWSYGHIWFGRIAIILGIVNGGLGLQLAKKTRFLAPSEGAVIGYSVVAGFFGLAYILAAIFGERKRTRSQTVSARAEVPTKSSSSSDRERSPRDAPRREFYKTERGYVRRASRV
jgi:hypothetical protein